MDKSGCASCIQTDLKAIDIKMIGAIKKILSVTEITQDLKNLIEENFFSIWVRGEISNYKQYASGHIYFTLKDEGAQISAVLFRGHQARLKFKPTDGMRVIVHGHLGIYEARGQYQIIVDQIEPDGIGALQMAFEQLKEKLKNEGLFEPARKRSLPFLPKIVGIVTSLHGAAIHDMMTILKRRFSGIVIRIYPVKVQGDGAAQEIAQAIRYFSDHHACDVLLVGRGGGSLEDLWAFNEEIVARAVFQATMPVISAVGHETDFTICDFVADLRAPTPSAAAELCVPVQQDLINSVIDLKTRMTSATRQNLATQKKHLHYLVKAIPTPRHVLERLLLRTDDLGHRLFQAMHLKIRNFGIAVSEYRLRLRSPANEIKERQKKTDYLRKNLQSALKMSITKMQHQLLQNQVKLELLSPLAILKRGYVISRDENGKIIKSKNETHAGQNLNIIFHDGEVKSRVV